MSESNKNAMYLCLSFIGLVMIYINIDWFCNVDEAYINSNRHKITRDSFIMEGPSYLPQRLNIIDLIDLIDEQDSI